MMQQSGVNTRLWTTQGEKEEVILNFFGTCRAVSHTHTHFLLMYHLLVAPVKEHIIALLVIAQFALLGILRAKQSTISQGNSTNL